MVNCVSKHGARIIISLLAVALRISVESASGLEAHQKPPEFYVPGDKNQIVSLSQFQGKLIYLDFWASWCGPCKKSLPWLNTLQSKYGDRGLTVIAVNLDSNREAAEEFLHYIKPNFIVGYDPDGRVPQSYQLKVMPSSYLIGRDGKILSIHEGFHERTKRDIEDHIASSL